MPSRYSTDYRNLRPYVLEDVRAIVSAAISAGWSGGNAAALTPHRLDDTTAHVGTLADSQAPQFLMRNGSRSLAGNLPVDTGVTIDGVDLDVHAANPDAHHARTHVLATAAGLGADHSMSGAAAGQVLRANSATNAMWAYLSHNDLTGVTADQHHAKQHDIIDAANHTVTGAAWSVVGATAANTLGLMLARSDATGTPKETLLKSDASGYLSLVRLIASDRLRTSLLDTPTGQHLTVQPAVDLLLDPVSKLVKLQTDVALQASNYASQVTGWRITHNGQADFRYLFVDEMHAKSFIADLEQALAGGQIISKSVAMLATAFTAPGGTSTAPSYRATATGNVQGQSSITISKPAGTVSGDVMVAALANWTSRTISSAPSGWTLLTTQTGGTYTQLLVYYKVAGGSEPANYTWTYSGTDDIAGSISTYYGVDTSGVPVDVYGGQGGASTTSVTAPSITTTLANTRLVFLAGFSDSNNTNGSATPPASFTERADLVAGAYAWTYAADATQAAAGASGTKTATLAGAHQYAAVLLALKPLPGGATTTLTVRDLPSAPGMAVYQAGDIVRVRQFTRSAGSLSIADCWGAVTGYVDNGDKTQTWTFTRSSSPNAGGMAAGTVIQPDSLVLDYGTDGNGFAETNAIDGANAINSPYLQFVRWTGHPATGQAVRTRLGQLRGIFGQDEFGLFAGTGTANTDRYVRISDYAAGNGINNLPFSLRNAGVEVVRLGGWNDVWFSPDGGTTKKLAWDGSNLTIIGSVTITGGSGYGNLSDKPTSLSAINNGESTKLAGIAAGATVGATWGTNLGSIPIRFADAPSGNGLYLTASYMGYYVGGAWKTYIDNGGNFRFSYDASNYLEFNASTNRLRGVGGGTDQWYASAVDGKLYFGGGAGVLHASGMTLYRQLETDTPGLSWMVGTTNYGGLSYYHSGGGGTFETVGLKVRADPSRIVLAVYNPGDPNNPPASITIQQNAYVPLVTIKGVVAVPVGKLTSDNTFVFRNAADSAYQNMVANSLSSASGYVTSDTLIQLTNTAANAYQAVTAGAMRSTLYLGLLPQASTPTTDAVYCLLYIDNADGKLKYKTTSGAVRTISYT